MKIIFILVFSLFFISLPVNGRVYAKAPEGAESIQGIKEELERLSDESYSNITSEEFGLLADEYVQLLIQSKEREGEDISGEYILNPPLSIQYEGSLFTFLLPNGQSFNASVTNGMITTEAVKMIPLDSFLVTIRRDGKIIKQSSAGIYSEPGSYHVSMVGYGNTDSITEDFNIYGIEFYFRILALCSNDINYIYPPEAYLIDCISCDGINLNASEHGCFLANDGEYEITFTSEVYPEKSYHFKFKRDTKAPKVLFAQEITGGKAVSPVYYEISEPFRELDMIFNGMELSDVTYSLEKQGVYHITVQDLAGNQSVTTVEVIKYDPLLGNLWIIIIVIFIFLVSGILLSARRIRMKIL